VLHRIVESRSLACTIVAAVVWTATWSLKPVPGAVNRLAGGALQSGVYLLCGAVRSSIAGPSTCCFTSRDKKLNESSQNSRRSKDVTMQPGNTGSKHLVRESVGSSNPGKVTRRRNVESKKSGARGERVRHEVETIIYRYISGRRFL
jgi:hypothetical protein